MTAVVGRNEELVAVRQFLDGAGEGAAALAIEGEPGIGKTTIWREAVTAAEERGLTVLSCRPAQAEATLAYAALADLLAPLGREAVRALPRPQRRALEVALLRTDDRGPPLEGRVVSTALLSLVRLQAAGAPVLLAVDDLQWLDSSSAAALAFAARRLDRERVALLLAIRSPGEHELLRALPQEHVRRLALQPLSAAALHRIVAESVGLHLARPAVVRLAEASGGNPLHAREIARLLSTNGFPSPGSPLPVPDGLRALVAERVALLPGEARAALLRAASVSRPDVELVDPAPLAAAEEAGLVRIDDTGRIEFSHPLFAAAVSASAPLAHRRETHRALADAVADPEERARHLALAARGPDEGVATVVDAAGRRARARGAPAAAAELAELALRLTPPGSPRALERRIELAELLYLGGDFERGARLLEEARPDLPPGDVRACALLLLSELAYRLRDEAEGAAIAREALAAAEDAQLRARCHVRLAGWATTSDVRQADADVEQALALLEATPTPDPTLTSFALATRVKLGLYLGRGLDEEAARRALVLERARPPRDVDDRVLYMLGVWRRYIDDLAGARSQLLEAHRVAVEEGDESSLVNILLNRLVVELWAGERSRADELAGELADAADQLGLSRVARVWIAYVDAHRGPVEPVGATVPGRRAQDLLDMLSLRALGTAALFAERYDEADEHLTRACEWIDAVGILEPAIFRVDGDAVEAALGVGDLLRAEALVGRFERRAARSPIPWSLAVSARARGLLLAAHGSLEEAASRLEQAVVLHEASPVPFERARSLHALGRVRRRLKQKRLARLALEDALALFREVGAEPWARRTQEELRRVSTRRSPETLTTTEQEIARLASEGLTNAAIAERVFVTVNTVEANLRRAYRKLGITSRAQLARALDERATPIS